jgi:outer membrane protein assembly factor BamB
VNASTGVVLWRYETGGWVYWSPAGANGVVYVGAGDDGVCALDATTGSLLWTYLTNGEIRTSPAVVHGGAEKIHGARA